MEVIDNNHFDSFDDDIEVTELIEMGVPRQIYIRHNYFDDLDELKFFQRFRLTRPRVLDLLVKIEDQLEFATNRNEVISPINQLLTTLSLCNNWLESVKSYIYKLYEEVVKIPSSIEKIKQSQNEFYNIARFPRVIGTIDGTHIKIESP
ncbi:hypothetical protein BDFB_009695, partial [Asbolus verrucosus]